MVRKLGWLTLLVLLPLALVFGCGDRGKVVQGRVISKDKDKKQVDLVLDVKHELGNPIYDQLPPVTYEFPSDPAEMGPEPKAGNLMEVDPDKKEITIYDAASQSFVNIPYKPIEVITNVSIRDPRAQEKFPKVDRDKKTITVYHKRKRLITTFSLPEEYFKMPDETFGFGDEVRIYAKLPGKSHRLMNISETDIYKK